MEVEIWKALPGAIGVEVSTLGRVRTLDKMVSSENGTRFLKGRVLKQNKNHNGYLLVNIPINEKQATKRVHRLVAQAFISNPDNFPEVNHLDCNRTNNNIENLEWCTSSYNAKYREKFGESLGKPVFAINLKTHEVSQFSSQHEVSCELGVAQSNINAVLKGTQKTAYGFWFVNDDGHAVDVVKSKLHDVGGIGLKI